MTAGDVRASGIVVSNVALQGGAAGHAYVKADVGWEYSWRARWVEPVKHTNENWDAAWIFVKYRVATNGAPWRHASLSTNAAEHTIVAPGAPATLCVGLSTDAGGASFGCGVFVYRAAQGSGNWTNTVRLRWNHARDGVPADARVEFAVHALEMVYVPRGGFYVGSGGDERGSFTDGAWIKGISIPLRIAGGAALKIEPTRGCLWSVWEQASIGQAGVLPAAYPKGYDAFYCMKYELSQGQWVDFFNTLTEEQKSRRDITRGPYQQGGKGTDAETNRNTVAWTAGDATCQTPDRACNFLSWEDLAAYADWAGLRPMTELEYEKACRGSANSMHGEYAWGLREKRILKNLRESKDGSGTEAALQAEANCICDNPRDIQGPVRCGMFASGASGRVAAGATYWGIMEMSGNLWEGTVSVTDAGRGFTGIAGDGTLGANGNATVAGWPVLAGTGVRGGGWNDPWYDMAVSQRRSASWPNVNRMRFVGIRAVRQAPEDERQ